MGRDDILVMFDLELARSDATCHDVEDGDNNGIGHEGYPIPGGEVATIGNGCVVSSTR